MVENHLTTKGTKNTKKIKDAAFKYGFSGMPAVSGVSHSAAVSLQFQPH